MAKTEPFDKYQAEYDKWFGKNYRVYRSELNAVRSVAEITDDAVEIGIGSGMFAVPLGINRGVEPSEAMRKTACESGLDAIDGVAEKLPYEDNCTGYVLMTTTLCFVDDSYKAVKEVFRILKPDGVFVLGFVDKNSPLGKIYNKKKDKSLFYKNAVFYSTDEVHTLLENAGFTIEKTIQTVFGALNEIREIQDVKDGYGEGSFIVIKASKTG